MFYKNCIICLFIILQFSSFNNATIPFYSKHSEKCRLYSTGSDSNSTAQFPYLASVGYITCGNHISWSCEGALLSTRYILTTALCLTGALVEYKPPDLKIRLGGAKPVVYNVESFIKYPGYGTGSFDKDIGLAKVSELILFNANIRPICLPIHRKLLSPVYQLTKNPIRMNNTFSLVKYPVQMAHKKRCNHGHKILLNTEMSHRVICTRPRRIYVKRARTLILLTDHPSIDRAQILIGLSLFEFEYQYYTKVYDYVKWIERIVWSSEEDMEV